VWRSAYQILCKCNSSSNVPILKIYKGLFTTLPDADNFSTIPQINSQAL
jgi:hypothetical protein